MFELKISKLFIAWKKDMGVDFSRVSALIYILNKFKINYIYITSFNSLVFYIVNQEIVCGIYDSSL